MSNTPLDHDPAIQRLIQEGYHVTLLPSHVVVNNVPYVKSDGSVADAKIIMSVTISGETVSVNEAHQVDFMGEMPYTASGESMEGILSNTVTGNKLSEGIVSNIKFSNKPVGEELDDCYKKYKHYESLICREAQVVNPEATARVFKPTDRVEETVFRYADTNVGRAGITEQADRLRKYKIGIVGLGGTGAYVLDKIAKTAVAEIHLYDGDVFENHNAFRAPGAATIDQLKQGQPKVTYFYNAYDPMRIGIVPHPYYVTAENVNELKDLEFVFICVDTGASRKIIAEYLCSQKIPFIDTGIDVLNRNEGNLLEGTVRTVLVTPENAVEAMSFLSFGDLELNDNLYSSNIQIAELNDFNACSAIFEWKKYIGFYANDTQDKFQMLYFTQDNKLVS